jgi:hypothetical protein
MEESALLAALGLPEVRVDSRSLAAAVCPCVTGR